jgi:heat shock protein HslJ
MRYLSAFLLLGLVGLAFAGCTQTSTSQTASSPAAAPGSPELKGTAWRLEDLGAVSAIPGVEATLQFPEAGKAAGRASCNRFFGTVEISGASIQFGPLASTKMACIDDAANAQEKKYLDALGAAERFAFDGPALLIYSRGNDQPLRFSRK